MFKIKGKMVKKILVYYLLNYSINLAKNNMMEIPAKTQTFSEIALKITETHVTNLSSTHFHFFSNRNSNIIKQN